jgi:hypothetical protein
MIRLILSSRTLGCIQMLLKILLPSFTVEVSLVWKPALEHNVNRRAQRGNITS